MKKPPQNLKLNKEVLNKKGKLPNVYSQNQYLIWTFLKDPKNCDWRKEGVIAQRLWKKYPRLSFWEFVRQEMGFELNTMLFFYSEKGKAILNECKFFWKEFKKLKKDESWLNRKKKKVQ